MNADPGHRAGVTQTGERTVVEAVVQTQSPGQPGFGIAVAVVLLTAMLLAVRRRN